jgi:hypothetical protein
MAAAEGIGRPNRRGSARESAAEPVAAAAEHDRVRQRVVRGVVVDVVHPQRRGRAAARAAAALVRDQARVPLLVAAAADPTAANPPKPACRAGSSS